MKINLRKMAVLYLVGAFLVASGLVACVDKDTVGKGKAPQGISDEELGLRKTTLFDEKDVFPATGTPAESTPGSSKRIARSFENAPPLIPHDLTGLLPITIDDNSCVGCHMPEAATAIDAVAVPKSHLIEPASGEALQGELHAERFNCMQCHVQQVELQATVENTFKAEFRDERSKYSSNLADTSNEGVK